MLPAFIQIYNHSALSPDLINEFRHGGVCFFAIIAAKPFNIRFLPVGPDYYFKAKKVEDVCIGNSDVAQWIKNPSCYF